MDDIVITGYGIKAPGVCDKLSFLDVLKSGICTQSLLKDPLDEPIVAGMIHDDFIKINEKNYKRSSRVRIDWRLLQHWMHVTCRIMSFEPHRVAVIIGTAAGAIFEIEANATDFLDLKRLRFRAFHLLNTHTVSGSVATSIGACGPAFTLTTGCTASLDASFARKTPP